MKIEDLKVCTIAYEIRDNAPDGTILERFDTTEPLTIMAGVGHMMKGFYEGILGLDEGDDFCFSIAPERAFGPHNPELVTDVPTELFMDDGKLNTELMQVGKIVKIQSPDDDVQDFDGRVLSINDDDTVTIDFNNQMAGHTLYVSGKVLGVRNATIEEMDKIVDERMEKGPFRYHGQNCGCKECQGKQYRKLY